MFTYMRAFGFMLFAVLSLSPTLARSEDGRGSLGPADETRAAPTVETPNEPSEAQLFGIELIKKNGAQGQS